MKKVIITVGPSLLYGNKLKEIDACHYNSNYIYRINGAHGSVGCIEEYANEIRSQLPNANILIDLPGNKIRTQNLDKPIQLEVGKDFRLSAHEINFKEFYKYLKVGDTILANDSTLKFKVQDVNENEITFTSKSEGLLSSDKGLHASGVYNNMPFLFQKDRELTKLANRHKISFLGLSYVRNVDDINLVKKLVDSDIALIAKVETKAAVDNLNDILQSVDYILIDRGDLSTEVGLVRIPAYQTFIVEKALFYNKKAFLSTQFLKNMENSPVPSIAEIIDLYNTLKMGVYGIQLSEETAVGKYPEKCLDVIKKIIQEIDSEIK